MTDSEFDEKFLVHRKAATNYFKIKYKLTRDESEDMVQNAYLKIYTRFKDQDVNCIYPKKYLFDTIKNCIFEFKTRSKYIQNEKTFTQMNVEFPYIFIDSNNEINLENVPQNILEHNIISDELKHLIDKLSEKNPEMSEALNLFYFEDMQVNEVAEKLNVPINTIKTRLFRGKHKLKTLIKDNMHLSTL
jgi:RNA polymerase sigma factor (sigma-70 family)